MSFITLQLYQESGKGKQQYKNITSSTEHSVFPIYLSEFMIGFMYNDAEESTISLCPYPKSS